MKICHMTSAHPPEDIRIFQKECVSLANAGHEVYLVERGNSDYKQGVHIVGFGEPSPHRIRRMLLDTRRVYRMALALDCDVYHFHDPELLPYGRKLKKHGKRVIFDSHELTREQIKLKPYLPQNLRAILSAWYGRYEDRVLQTLDAVIFPCRIDGKFPLAGRRHVLLNNVPRLEELYEQYDPGAEKRYDACMVGLLSYERGITHLVKAAEALDVQILVGGVFDSEEYEKEIRERNASQHVVFLGKLERDKVLELLQHSRIGICMLLNQGQYEKLENLPTKAYEYMALGLPVVLTKRPYHEKLVAQYHFGICADPEDAEEYSQAIRYLLDHPDEAREMGENGRRAIRQVFNWQQEERKLLELYESLAGKTP